MANYLKLATTFHASQNKTSFHVFTSSSSTSQISPTYPHIHMTMSAGSSSSFGTQKRDMNLKVAHVTANVIAPSLPPLPRTQKEETKSNGGRLAAWTSIKQERWEGELQVEGDIPLWLVY